MRRALALVGGAALYALAFPPVDGSVFAWFALVPLLLAVRDRSATFGLVFGALYGFACAWGVAGWLAQALARYFDVGLPLGILVASLYAIAFWATAFGLFGAGAAVLTRRHHPIGVRLAIPALWVTTELLRGRFLGQPWGLLGYTQHAHPELIQLSAITAVYGVSFVVALGNTALAEAIALVRRRADVPRAVYVVAVPAVFCLVVSALGGIVASRGPAGGFGAQPVVVVQTNVAPAWRWTRAYTDAQIAAHLGMLQSVPGETRPGLIVWPEHAVPRYLEEEPGLAAQLATVARTHRADLLFGSPRFASGRTYNSVRLLTRDGRNGGHYDKQRLVLFAESRPFDGAAAPEPSENPERFTAGTEPGVLHGFVDLGVSVCHEILFPELVADSVAAGAALLVNVSNDGWLDAGSGIASRQHFAMAVFRAVETRRYLVRAATTGVSGVIDPYGRVLAQLPPRSAGIVHRTVAGRSGMTPYVAVGDVFAFGCALASALVLYATTLHPLRRRHLGLARPFPASI